MNQDIQSRVRPVRGAKLLTLVMMMVASTMLSTVAMAPTADAALQWVKLPVPRAQTNLSELQARHHDYPAADIPVPSGTPVYAVVGGTVRSTFYQAGGCGYGVTIVRGNSEYTYCHGNGRFDVSSGQAVATGGLIMRSGNTGASSGPHLHLQIRIDGQLRCPQPLLVAAWYGRTYDPQALPRTGCYY
jgi:hypothetical protein